MKKIFLIKIYKIIIKSNIKINQIKFIDKKEKLNFQNILIKLSSSIKKINNIIKLSKNLTESLTLIYNNIETIKNMLLRNKDITQEYYYFSDLNEEDNIMI